ncbi:hypothetical protein [Treponema endosymbiont of Eucomonympha sp.]|uniref:hypothetical protein n=1 Tax=Treponema endosymbiont of Eucomonympha sp. TaxID=1580831 RepID=UPI000B04CE1F|nr:hypothetical protein [Treponema endosymbiont of Eucomonympha sp.]
MVIDSDALIWYMRGNQNAQTTIHNNIPFKISVINYMEVVQGMKDKRELSIFQKYLKKWSADILQINENISAKAMFLVENYFFKPFIGIRRRDNSVSGIRKSGNTINGKR